MISQKLKILKGNKNQSHKKRLNQLQMRHSKKFKTFHFEQENNNVMEISWTKKPVLRKKNLKSPQLQQQENHSSKNHSKRKTFVNPAKQSEQFKDINRKMKLQHFQSNQKFQTEN